MRALPMSALPFVLALFDAAMAAQAPPPPPPPAGYEPQLWQKAWALHHDALVIDTHVDTTSRILDRGFDVGPRANDGHFDLVRAQEGGLDAVFHSIYVDARFAGDERALFATAPQDINADWPRPGDPGAAVCLQEFAVDPLGLPGGTRGLPAFS